MLEVMNLEIMDLRGKGTQKPRRERLLSTRFFEMNIAQKTSKRLLYRDRVIIC